MRIVLQKFTQVLNKGFLALSSKFAQIFVGLAPTKSATFQNSDSGVLDSFEAVKLFTFLFISQIFHPLFFAVKSLGENLVINSGLVMP